MVIANGAGRNPGLARFRSVPLTVPPKEEQAGPNPGKYKQTDEMGYRTPSAPGSTTVSGRLGGSRLPVDPRLPGTFPGRCPSGIVTSAVIAPGRPD